MKKIIAIMMAGLMATSLAGCAGKQPAPDEDICPGKQVGAEGVPMVPAEGFDTTVDMSFTTVDTNGDPITNEVFGGTEHGVWLVFWQTDNEKSAAELARLNDMLPIAEENGYKIVGMVMDGEKNGEKAKEMTADLGFTNLIWNDAVAARYEGIADFFSKEFYEANQAEYEEFKVKPELGDPVSTYANSRGQIQSSCFMIPPSNEKIETILKTINANATYEELLEQERDSISN